MYTAIWGEIKGAPTESLIFYFQMNKFPKEKIRVLTEAIQKHIYYDEVVQALKDAYEEHFAGLMTKRVFNNTLETHRKTFGPRLRKHAFTDDTVLSIATMEVMLLMAAKGSYSIVGADTIFAEKYRDWARKYPAAGFGGQFRVWFKGSNQKPYYSMANGSAMRTGPLAYLPLELFDILQMARTASAVTHNHPEGIRGALAVTHAAYTALHQTKSKSIIKGNVEEHYYYDLSRTLADIRPKYKFEVLAQNSVPEAIISFWESTSAISAVENAISLGGDTDTQAMIAGSIADAFYGYESIPAHVKVLVHAALPNEMLDIFHAFNEKFVPSHKAVATE